MSALTPFGIAIRKLRLDKGLRLVDMAQAMGVSSAYLSAVETGRKPIPDGLVTKLSRGLNWSAAELAAIRKAIDQTRKEVRLDDKKHEDRELIAAFARRLDELPPNTLEELKKLLLKSEAGEVPFERRRRGLVVPPLSRKAIWDYAERVRDALGQPDRFAFPIMDFIEFFLCKIDQKFVLEVFEPEEMAGDEGRVPIGENRLILRSDVYEDACRGARRHRFTAAHELGHYLMHRRISLARARSDSDKIFVDAEWQADTFAGALLMSPRHAPQFAGPDDMAEECLTSREAAAHMWRMYSKEGIVAAAP